MSEPLHTLDRSLDEWDVPLVKQTVSSEDGYVLMPYLTVKIPRKRDVKGAYLAALFENFLGPC